MLLQENRQDGDDDDAAAAGGHDDDVDDEMIAIVINCVCFTWQKPQQILANTSKKIFVSHNTFLGRQPGTKIAAPECH